MRVAVLGIGVLAPGLDGWAHAREVLAGKRGRQSAMRTPNPSVLSAAERRRASLAIRLALDVAEQAVRDAGVAADELTAVFASCDGDGDTIHAVLDAIAAPDHPVSPTRFTNSVHNAPAGYWSIGMRATVPSTSVCAWEGSGAAGLLEAATQVAVEERSVLFVCSDCPLPRPLDALHPTRSAFGAALVLGPAADGCAMPVLDVRLAASTGEKVELEPNGAARLLPVLAALTARSASTVRLPYLPELDVLVDVHARAAERSSGLS